MSTDTTSDSSGSTQDGNNSGGSTSDAGDTFTPPSSQEELNRIIERRLERERSKYADYDDLKQRAARLDEIEAEQLSEAEKAQKRAEEAERERDQARAEALRLRIAAKYGVSAEDAELFLTAGDEETLEAQAKRLADREADRKRAGDIAPSLGSRPTHTGATDERDFVRQLFGKPD